MLLRSGPTSDDKTVDVLLLCYITTIVIYIYNIINIHITHIYNRVYIYIRDKEERTKKQTNKPHQSQQQQQQLTLYDEMIYDRTNSQQLASFY